eukprot:m51a1_g330 putative 60S ribosomal protein L6e (260) ;mRNA; f:467057-468039
MSLVTQTRLSDLSLGPGTEMVKNYLLRKSLTRWSAAARARFNPTLKHKLTKYVKPTRVVKAAPKDAAPAPQKYKVTVPSPRNVLPLSDRRQRVARHFTPATAKLRRSIKPGTVLIMLAGRFKGKRVVFLKQLPSGLLLVTGPFKINGVPLRRVNQAHVIATSTRIRIGSVKVDAAISDATFTKTREAAKRKGEAEFFKDKKEGDKPAAPKAKVSAEFVAQQKAVDSQLLPLIKKVPVMALYLRERFGLANNEYPHLMKF